MKAKYLLQSNSKSTLNKSLIFGAFRRTDHLIVLIQLWFTLQAFETQSNQIYQSKDRLSPANRNVTILMCNLAIPYKRQTKIAIIMRPKKDKRIAMFKVTSDYKNVITGFDCFNMREGTCQSVSMKLRILQKIRNYKAKILKVKIKFFFISCVFINLISFPPVCINFFIVITFSMVSKIQLYIDYISQPSRTVLAFCLFNSIPFEINEIRIAKLQHLSQEYTNVNPMKKVPAIYDPSNGLTLGQSHAIVSYLMRKYKLEDRWGLQDQRKCARIDQYLHFHHQNTRRCSTILYTQVFSRLYPVEQGQSLKNSSPRKEVQNVLNFIQEHYFKESVFMIGTSLTVADISAYYEIQSLVVVDYDYSKWPKITAWMSRVQQFQEIRQASKNFTKLLPKMKLPAAKL